MRFSLDKITHDSASEKRPLIVGFSTPPDKPAEDITDPLENFYTVKMTAKSLRTFSAFQEFVADRLGIWLVFSGSQEKWDDAVRDLFAVDAADNEAPVSLTRLRHFTQRRLANAQRILRGIENLTPFEPGDYDFLVGPTDVDLAAKFNSRGDEI